MLNCMLCCSKITESEINEICICYECTNLYGTWRCNHCNNIFSEKEVYEGIKIYKNTPFQHNDMYCTMQCFVEENPVVDCSYCKDKYRLSEGYSRFNGFFGYCSYSCDRMDCI